MHIYICSTNYICILVISSIGKYLFARSIQIVIYIRHDDRILVSYLIVNSCGCVCLLLVCSMYLGWIEWKTMTYSNIQLITYIHIHTSKTFEISHIPPIYLFTYTNEILAISAYFQSECIWHKAIQLFPNMKTPKKTRHSTNRPHQFEWLKPIRSD